MVITTIVYVLVALVLTGTVPLTQIDTQAPIAHAMRMMGKDWFAGFISVGALCALTSVLLIYQLGTTRILYAMSRDKFLPKFSSFSGIDLTKFNLKSIEYPHEDEDQDDEDEED